MARFTNRQVASVPIWILPVAWGGWCVGAAFDTSNAGQECNHLYSAVRGMNDLEKPDQESWGGQYVRRDPAKQHWYDGPGASSVSKWLPEMQKDFAIRMDWCVIRD